MKSNDNKNDYHHYFNESIQYFFEALKTNTNSALKNFTQYNLDDMGFKSLETATACSSLSLSLPKTNIINTKIEQKLIEMGSEMLECNLSLENFSFFLFDNFNRLRREKKQMFLRLNQRGRRSIQHHTLRETISKSAWIDQLAKHSIDDLDGLYYYISTNPSICRPMIVEGTTCSTYNNILNTTTTNIDKRNNQTEREKSLANEHTPADVNDFLPSTRSNNAVAVDKVVPQTKRQRFDDVSRN